MELVSVIVPIYKVEKYLVECLDSILSSTYTNLEVILVDDGSPDSCPAICDEYAAKDSRIQVIHQENQGLIGARNAGLAAASGKYVAFVDSDDVVSPVLYEQLVSALEVANADMSACEYTNSALTLISSYNHSDRTVWKYDDYDQKLSVLTCAPSIRNETWTHCYVWNKLYRRELIQSSFSSECLMCEDLRFNWDYISNCGQMVVVPAALYFYRLNEEGITGTYRKQKNSARFVVNGVSNAKLWAKIMADSPMRSTQLQNYLRARAAYTAHGALWRIYSTGTEQIYNNYLAEAKSLIAKHCTALVHDTQTYSFFLRFMCWLCCHCHFLWKLAAKVSKIIH